MKNYFFLQVKRVFRYFPSVLAVSLVLFLTVTAALFALVSAQESKSENIKVKIGVTGSTEDRLVQLGLSALQAFDDIKYSVELCQYEETEAHTALSKGEIAAYVVIPEDFVQQALYGNIEYVRFVTTTDALDIVTLFKDEILTMVTDILVAAQKGTYGIGDALVDQGHRELADEHINKIALQYLYLVLDRSTGVVVEELGIGNALTATQYYICSILIFFLMLMGLPFASLYCKKDHSLSALLHSKGISGLPQVGGEFFALFVGFMAVVGGIFVGVCLFIAGYGVPDGLKGISTGGGCPFLTLLLPMLMITAFTYMIFELSGNVIGGILTHFFLTVALCYLSGCFYPLYAFPEAVQKVAAVLPVCVLREHMAHFFTGDKSLNSVLPVLAYTVLFIGIAIISRKHKLSRHGGTCL